MIEPRRRQEPKKHLDASLVPLERALRERAEQLYPADTDPTARINIIHYELAQELRKIAEELHYW